MLTFDFRQQLLGDWETAKGFLVAQFDRLYAGLADPNAFFGTITTNPTTGITSVPFAGPLILKDGLFAQSPGLVSVSIAADQNNFFPAGLDKCSVLLVTAQVQGLNITGLLDPVSQGTNSNRFMYLVNVGSYNFTLVGSSANSNVASQFALALNPAAVSVVLQPNEGVWLFHHTQWLVMAVGQTVASATPYMARPDYRRVAGLTVSTASMTSGLSDFGMTGALTSVLLNNITQDAVSWWAEYRTAAAAGSVANLSWGNSSNTWCLAEHLPIIRWHVKTGADITNLRLWCGIMDTIPSAGSDTQAGQDGILFRYSTVASDPGWVGFASKSLGGNANSTTGLVAAIAASTVYDLQIRVASTTSVGFSVNGGAEVFLTTNIPVIAQYGGFGMSPVIEVESREAATKSLYVSRGHWDAN